MIDKNKTVNELCQSFHAFAVNKIPPRPKYNDPGFTVRPENEPVIKALVLYFVDHAESKLDQEKGIYLYGPCGTGKTTLMQLLSQWTNNSFRFISCRDLQQEFAMEGYKGILKYTKKSFHFKNNCHSPANGPITYCFDDFGSEGKSAFYGNKVNIMEEIFQDRYRMYEEYGMITHTTSNLKPNTQLLNDTYTIRVSDRINGMYNKIELLGDSFRK